MILVPQENHYAKITDKIPTSGHVASERCMGQCTGCVCSCRCACKSTDMLLDWEETTGASVVVPKSDSYAMTSGKILSETSAMARCACVSCNTCTCACSCRGPSSSISFDF